MSLLFLLACTTPEVESSLQGVELEGAPMSVQARSPSVCEPDELLGFTEPELGTFADRPPNAQVMGASIADFDRDGWQDVILPTKEGTLYYRGSEEGLFEESKAHFPPQAINPFRAVSVSDVDGDGWLDAILLGREVNDILLINNGDGTFRAQQNAGLQQGGRSIGASFGDLDGDQDLDLVVASGGTDGPHGLYENLGDGTFRPRSDWAGPELQFGSTFHIGILDLDQDGWMDLYEVTDNNGGGQNIAYFNRGDGTFERRPEAGLDIRICGMGLGIGDTNGDQLPDLAVSDCENIVLLESAAESGVWVDHSSVRGVETDRATDRVVPWGLDFADFDNDADLDLFVPYGFIYDPRWPQPKDQPDGLYERSGDTFVQSAEAWNIADLGSSRGFAMGDLNNDGSIDMIKPAQYGRARWFQGGCTTNDWLRVSLRSEGPNTHGVGAKIRVLWDDNPEGVTRWILAGAAGAHSSHALEAHFGLGEVDWVRVEVTWPDGEVSMVSGVGTRQIVELTRLGG